MEGGDPYGRGDCGLDETLGLVREQFTRFGADRVQPFAHQWHLDDRLIPIDVVQAMADLGTFGLTVPEEYGGLGMGKEELVAVSETLSRPYIGFASLGTTSAIAATMIRLDGTGAPKAQCTTRNPP